MPNAFDQYTIVRGSELAVVQAQFTSRKTFTLTLSEQLGLSEDVAFRARVISREDGSGLKYMFAGSIDSQLGSFSAFYNLSHGEQRGFIQREPIITWPSSVNHQYEIKDGPGVNDFMSSLFVGNWKHRQSVNIKTTKLFGELRKPFVVINGIKAVAHDSNVWEFFGYVANSQDLTKVSGLYNVYNRTGWLKEI